MEKSLKLQVHHLLLYCLFIRTLICSLKHETGAENATSVTQTVKAFEDNIEDARTSPVSDSARNQYKIYNLFIKEPSELMVCIPLYLNET